MTIGDKFRTMSDEQLAELIDESCLYEEHYCIPDAECDNMPTQEERRKKCRKCILNWLKKGSED